MELEHKDSPEILPENIGSLSSSEAAPLLTRAASRIDMVRPKNEFWNGMRDNLRGATAYIEAQKAKFKGRTLNIITGASLVATMVSACSKPPETPYIPTEAPRATETIPTEMPLPTETPTQILTETPTVEPSPTPTEIPRYEGKLFENPWDYSANIDRIGGLEINIYEFNVGSTLVQKQEIAGSNITEYVWGFSIDGVDHFYRVNQAPFTVPVSNGDWSPRGYFPPETELGAVYGVVFIGANEPIPYAMREQGPDTSGDDGWRILSELSADPGDQARLRNFFTRGDESGFEIDELGVIDLRNVIIIEDIRQ